MGDKSEKRSLDTKDKFKTTDKNSKTKKSKDPCAEELQKQMDVVHQLETQIQYLQADMDNLRKYYERQWRDRVSLANDTLMRELLPTLDSLELAACQTRGQTTEQGIALILKEFKKTLSKFGLAPIKTVGEKFDPKYHEVLGKEASELEEDTIIEELQRGYLLNNKVLRYAKVRISGGPKNG